MDSVGFAMMLLLVVALIIVYISVKAAEKRKLRVISSDGETSTLSGTIQLFIEIFYHKAFCFKTELLVSSNH